MAEFDLGEHEMVLLRQAVHVTDACERLQELVDQEGLLVEGRTHPALVELRQQRQLLGRLIVALRVPLGEEEPETAPAAGGARTQRRPVRGFYAVRGGAS